MSANEMMFCNHDSRLVVLPIGIRALLMLVLVSTGAVAQRTAETPRTIRVVMDNAYAPYSFRSDEGKLQGILIDQWRAWERKTGIKVEIDAMDWGEALRRMRAGEFDVIDSIFETAERRDYFDFTPAYTPVEASIFFRNDISGITDIASLKGFPVGVKAGDQHIDQLKANGVTTVILFQNNDAIIEAAKQRKINVFVVDDPSAIYLLNKAGIEGEFRHSAPTFQDELRRAVRKGNTALLREVSDGFAAIDPDELTQINERWFGRTINRIGRYLTYAGYAAAAALLLIAGLAGWNRSLRKRVLERTAALSHSEQRLRQIAEHIREVFWMATPAMDETLYVSPAYESIWGRSLESLRQRPQSFFEAIHAQDREHAVGLIKGQREEGFDIEYRIVRPDGTMRWIRDRGFPVKDASGKVYRIAGVADDITMRKEAEEALRQAEDHLRLVLDTTPALIHTGHPDGYLDYFNQRWLKYVGLSLEDLQGWAWTATIHPGDVEGIVNAWRASLTSGEPLRYEARVRRADGAYRWMLHHKVPLRDEHSNILKWYGSSMDIEDRKQAEEALRESEQRFRRLVELMPVAVYTCDTSGIIQIYNRRAVELWGREPKPGDTAQRYCASLRLYSPEGELVPHEESEMAEVLRTGTPASDLEVVIERPDGSCITVLVNIASLRNRKGDLVGAMNCFQDITERKQAAKELEEMNHQLRFLSHRLFQIQEEERRHLARELHDEIGQALTAARINTDMLRAAVPPDLLARLNENAAILDRLLQQTRQISLDLRPPLLDDLGLVPALRWYVNQQAERVGLNAKFSADPLADDIPPHIQITCFRIAQEAITNVVRHAHAKTLTVELRPSESSLRLLVRDDGKGFDVAAAKARAEQGASLGLLGIKERAALAGGSAQISSIPDEGTTVEILLPLSAAEGALPVSGTPSGRSR